ncbi:MAG: hypothetical protein Q8L46_00735 [candidate division WWE3 bacterium]|nr:hypothetical protein [candidate division WWE3 bacterium]
MSKKFLLPLAIIVALGLAWGGWTYLKNRGGSSEDTTTPGGEDTTSGTTECPVGGYWSAGGVNYRITGYENHSLGGSSQRLCCGTWDNIGDNEKMKYCYDVGAGDYYIAWTSNAETGGKYVKAMESYKQGEQSCFKLYDAQENVVTESCQ